MEDKQLKQECDAIHMTEQQRQKIWRQAVKRAEGKTGAVHRRRKMALAVQAAVLCMAAGLFLLAGIVKYTKGSEPAAMLERSEPAEQTKQIPATEKPVRNYLLLGLDARQGEELEKSYADAILILRVDEENERAKLIAVPSALLLTEKVEEGQNDYKKKLQYADWSDDGENGLEASVEKWFGIPINGRIAVSFQGFASFINRIGGLELEVTEEDLDLSYAKLNGYLTEIVEVTGIGTSGQIEQTGLQHLDGPQTLAWCRVSTAQATDSGIVYGRGDRFLQVLQEMIKKIDSLSDAAAVCQLALQDVNTNLPVQEIVETALQVLSYDDISFENLITSQFVTYSDRADGLGVTDWDALRKSLAE